MRPSYLKLSMTVTILGLLSSPIFAEEPEAEKPSKNHHGFLDGPGMSEEKAWTWITKHHDSEQVAKDEFARVMKLLAQDAEAPQMSKSDWLYVFAVFTAGEAKDGELVEQMIEKISAQKGGSQKLFQLAEASSYLRDIKHGVPQACETVLSPHTEISAITANGKITIASGKGCKRYYTWDGTTRWVIMIPREKRWNGSLGLYFPGPGDHWKPHKGITRGVLEEGQRHFDSVEKAVEWLEELKEAQALDAGQHMSYVHSRDGLVVGWGRALHRNQLNVKVWQILIKGEKPNDLPKSIDDAITVRSLQEQEEKQEGKQEKE